MPSFLFSQTFSCRFNSSTRLLFRLNRSLASTSLAEPRETRVARAAFARWPVPDPRPSSRDPLPLPARFAFRARKRSSSRPTTKRQSDHHVDRLRLPERCRSAAWAGTARVSPHCWLG